MAEMNIPQPMDAAGKNRQYDEYMTRLYLSNATPEESSAFRLMLLDTTLEVVGEAADWFTTVVEVPISHVDMLLLDWDMLPINSPGAALNELRMVCPSTLIVIFISEQDAQKQAALSIAADMFITKGETPKRIAERLEVVAAGGLAQ